MKSLCLVALLALFCGCSKPSPAPDTKSEPEETSAPSTATSEPLAKPVLPPFALAQLTELYRVGNEFNGAISSGVSLVTFSQYSAKLRGVLDSTLKLLPEEMSAAFERQAFLLRTALITTEQAWRLKTERSSTFKDYPVRVTILTHPDLVTNLMMAGNQNPFGLKFTFGKVVSEYATEDIQSVNDFGQLGAGLSNGSTAWMISYISVGGQEYDDYDVLLSLCGHYYDSLEELILPNLK